MRLLALFKPVAGKTARNEGRKLLATAANTAGLATFAIGAVTPLFTRPFEEMSWVHFLASTIMLVGLHLAAQLVVRGVED